MPVNIVSPQTELTNLLKLSEVAAELRCSKAHVSNLTSGLVEGTPRLHTVRLGRRKLVLRSTLERWLAEVERGDAANDITSAKPRCNAVNA